LAASEWNFCRKPRFEWRAHLDAFDGEKQPEANFHGAEIRINETGEDSPLSAKQSAGTVLDC
jgi:hypothetical protein